MIYYHITDKEHGEKIQNDGYLIPKRGHNTRITGDFECVYFCDRDDIAVWELLLGKDYLLACEIGGGLIDRCYDGYREYMGEYRKKVYPSSIKPVSKTLVTKEERLTANERIGTGYLWFLNHICLSWAEYYHGLRDKGDILAKETWLWLEVVGRIDYASIPEKSMKKVMEEMDDSCCYAFTDRYDRTKYRLWEQLSQYPEDKYAKIRKKICNLVNEKLGTINKTDTGGWLKPR